LVSCKKVVCKGAGAGVLKDVDLMIRLTKAVINSTDLPVTVKTRLGWDDIRLILMRWQSGFNIGVAALSIHARTRSNVQGHSDWSHCPVKTTQITMPILVTEY
jgi:tRNA-dihydrouridine synthase